MNKLIVSFALLSLVASAVIAQAPPSVGPSDTSAYIPPVTPPPPVKAPLKWGVFPVSIHNDLPALEKLIGQKPNIVATFIDIMNPLDPSYAVSVGSRGQILLVYWESSVSLDAINNGDLDRGMINFNAAAEKYRFPILLAPLPEMNLNETIWGYGQEGNTPDKFIAVWRRMREKVTAENVMFVLDYNNVSIPNIAGNRFEDYYPGPDEVDYLAVNGFNRNTEGWQTFASVFNNAVKEIIAFNKPWFILSTACAPGSKKAAWIADMGKAVQTYTNLLGWVWFNEQQKIDWRINSDTNSLEAFKQIIPKKLSIRRK